MGTITVIIGAYNHASFLTQSLHSVFSQTRKPDEIIIFDDASIDNTQKVLGKYVHKLSSVHKKRIKYILHKKNLGPIVSINQGLSKARGDYIIFLPADDWFAPTILEKEAAILDRYSDIGVVYSHTYTVTNGKKEVIIAEPAGKTTVVERNEFGRLLTQGDFIPLLTGLFRKKAIDNLGVLDTNLRFHADHEFWIRLAKFYHFAYIAEPLAYYRVHGANDHLNASYLPSYEYEFLYILKKHLKRGDPKLAHLYSQAWRNYYFNLFSRNVLEGKFFEGSRFLWKSFASKPLSFSHLNFWKPFALYLKRRLI